MRKIQFKHFLDIKPLRNKKIDEASSELQEYHYIPNELAKLYHPEKQLVTITKIEEITHDIKRFTVKSASDVPLAPFKSGSYISIKFRIGETQTARPYSLTSTFNDALNGFYQFAIKKDPNGLCSSYAFDHFQVGSHLELSSPAGTFIYSSLRDSKEVIMIAGGIGITPFISMLSSIQEKVEDFKVTLFYGVKKIEDLAFKKELDELSVNKNIKIIYVLSDENTEHPYEKGFINKELIKAYCPSYLSSSYFVCGSKGLYQFIDKELDSLGIAKKYRRFELQGEAKNIHDFSDAPEVNQDEITITVHIWDETKMIKASKDKTILASLEEHGIAALNQCRSGECGFCHSSLVKGDVFMPSRMDHLRMADKIYNQIHLCCTFPLTDIEIIIAKD